MIIVNGWKPLTIITKHSILDVAAALDPSLIFVGKNSKHHILYANKLCNCIFCWQIMQLYANKLHILFANKFKDCLVCNEIFILFISGQV